MAGQDLDGKFYDTGASNMLPGIDCIGAGYNIFKGYASPRYISNRLFDWPNLPLTTFTFHEEVYQLPVAVNAIAVQSSIMRRSTGMSISSYQEHLATSVTASGSYLFFSGSVSVDFASDELTKSENAFSRIQQTIYAYTLRYTIDSSSRSLLTSTFRTALDSLDVNSPTACKNFLDAYGSHVLTGIIMGGRALRSSSTNKSSLDSTYSLDETASASFEVASGSAKLEASNEYSNAVQQFNESSHTIETIEGGDTELPVFNEDADTTTEWKRTVNKRPVFVDFHDSQPYMPIWELCDSTEAGQNVARGLAKYFDEVWSKEQTIHIDVDKEYPEYYSALTVTFGESKPTPPAPPEGYEMLKTDLNSDTNDMPLYLCYRRAKYDPTRSPVDQQAIWRVTIFNEGKNYRPRYGLWHVIPTDLNLDAGGDYLYLAYKTQPYDSETNILDLQVVAGEDDSVPVPFGYVKVDKDLNKGAGGDFVYLAYKKSKFDPQGDANKEIFDDMGDMVGRVPYPGT